MDNSTDKRVAIEVKKVQTLAHTAQEQELKAIELPFIDNGIKDFVIKELKALGFQHKLLKFLSMTGNLEIVEIVHWSEQLYGT